MEVKIRSFAAKEYTSITENQWQKMTIEQQGSFTGKQTNDNRTAKFKTGKQTNDNRIAEFRYKETD